MTRLTPRALVLTAVALVAAGAWTADHAAAQCCGTPVVAYSPVVAPAATVVDTGWYPGRLFDRWRMRRWSTTAAVAPTYTAAYAPASYTASYTPYVASYAPATYTAAYAPATYTAAYRPYVTAYAPLQPVVQTSYMPVTTVDSTCASCSYTSLRPVVTASYAPACGCPAEAPCSACSSCSGATVVEQAGYAQPSTGCASCAESSGVVQYSAPSGSTSAGPPTGAPALPPNYPEPERANYPSGGAKESSGAESASPEAATPGPAAEDEDAGSATSFEAPPLLPPANGDRTANRPTVNVHNAVYRQPARTSQVSTTAAKPIDKVAADLAAAGWHSTAPAK